MSLFLPEVISLMMLEVSLFTARQSRLMKGQPPHFKTAQQRKAALLDFFARYFASSAFSDTRTLAQRFVAMQCVFLSVGYLHAHSSGDLSWERSYVSAMLDDPLRSPLCACISLLSLYTLVALECSRDLDFRLLRVSLAIVCCFGIFLLCLIRESKWWFGHVLTTCVAFSAGLALVVVGTLCNHNRKGFDAASWIPAIALAVLTFITGTAQMLHVISIIYLSPALLALGECSMIGKPSSIVSSTSDHCCCHTSCLF